MRTKSVSMKLCKNKKYKKYKDSNWLTKQYWGFNKTIYNMAEMSDCSIKTINDQLKKYNIPRRNCGNKINYIKLTDYITTFIEGELLGDGCLAPSAFSAAYRHSSKHKEYIKWIIKQLKTSNIEQTGKQIYKQTITRKQLGKNNYFFKHLKKNEYIIYQCISLCYVELLDLYKKWYLQDFSFCPYCEIIFHETTTNRKEWSNKRICPVCNEHELKKKIIPEDLQLTPITVRQWYIGDGNYIKNLIRFSTECFLKKHILQLVDKLEQKNIKSHVTKDKAINIRNKEIIKFFKYIGHCPIKCYRYKWPE